MIKRSILVKSLTQLLQKESNIHLLLFFIMTSSLLFHVFCMNTANLLVEEAYYWNYSQHLDLSYLDHPPMVALLIKVFTSGFGSTEFGVRCASLFCWFITAFFAYRLSETICKKSGIYAILLLSVLPFFFFQSIVITPDTPLLSCWSAAIYFLYSALVLKKANAWYAVGVCLGLGMLSKYTICLLGFSTLGYLILSSDSRFWFKRKEPYLSVLIIAVIFSPVIYWNSTHEWVSFIFQSTRRFADTSSNGTFELFWSALFFLTPFGIWELVGLCKSPKAPLAITNKNKLFTQCVTLIPLGFFLIYSLNHGINFNWTGPIGLALIPWIAQMIFLVEIKRVYWIFTAFVLLLGYSSLLFLISYNESELIQQKLLIKVIAWDKLIMNLSQVAQHTEDELHKKVVFVPLDKYPISSELAFYQNQLLKNGMIQQIFPTIGAHIFNGESLMYRYWSSKENLSGKIAILLSKELWRFDDQQVTSRVKEVLSLSHVWSVGQGHHVRNIPYYYKIVEIK